MASIKSLKKGVTSALAELIDAVSIYEITSGKGQTEETKGLVNEILSVYDKFIDGVNDKKIENKKSHIQSLRKEFSASVEKIVEKLNKLG